MSLKLEFSILAAVTRIANVHAVHLASRRIQSARNLPVRAIYFILLFWWTIYRVVYVSDNGGSISKLQSKLMNMAEGKKISPAAKRRSRSRTSSRSRSRSRSVSKKKSVSRSRSRSRSRSKSKYDRIE